MAIFMQSLSIGGPRKSAEEGGGISSRRSRLRLVGLTAFSLLLFCMSAAQAEGLFSVAPTVHIEVEGVESQAQLAQTLRAQGYSDILLSSTNPSFTEPHPELNPERIAHPDNTPVRPGWNGVAVKDGRTVEVYATSALSVR